MARLWNAKKDYRKVDPYWREDLLDIDGYGYAINNRPEEFMPYERCYHNLTQKDLHELIADAKRFQWGVLDLHLCGLNSLPDELGNLTDLCVLLAGNWGRYNQEYYGEANTFKALPESLHNLKNLQSINVSRTKISSLPYFMHSLSNLQSLYLNDTQISVLPEWIGDLTRLQFLNLAYTKISALPDSIGKLKSLQSLNVWSLGVTSLPQSIGNLTNLRSLLLASTEIASLPDSIGNLVNLETLILDRSKIVSLPDSIGNLKKLKTLSLCHCHLQSIPYSVVHLGLPFVLDDSGAQNCINLTGTTIEEGDLSLFYQSHEIIEAYYTDRILDAVNECKVIFLGDGAAGKSSLVERIVNHRFEEGSLPTDGVRMIKWKTALGEKPLTLRFLDFGGQEIMHSMHRCFLTNHTIYVVVCESRDDAEIDSVAVRWMKTVHSFAPECPVILALNKSDLNSNVSVNERILSEMNPAFRLVLRTSAKEDNNPGVAQLVSAIFKEVPDCLRKMTGNMGILGLKRELEDMDSDYIRPDEYQELCAKYGIQESLRMGILDWFQDLGVVYSYSTLLRSVYVLNPRWLTNGIYRLILRTPNSGFLSHQTIRNTLKTPYPRDIDPNKVYTEQEAEFILYVMRRFEISMEIQGDQDVEEMIPMKMEKTPPRRYNDFPRNDALHLRWESSYLPNNLIHRLIIRKHHDLDRSCVWRTGGWFRQRTGGCEALAEMTDRTLDIYVSGSGQQRKTYLQGFREEVQNILRDLNVFADEVICYYADNDEEGYIPFDDLLYSYVNGDNPYLVSKIHSVITPSQLLSETYVDSEYLKSNKIRQYMGSETAEEQSEANILSNKVTQAEVNEKIANAVKTYTDIFLKLSATIAFIIVSIYLAKKIGLVELIKLLGEAIG